MPCVLRGIEPGGPGGTLHDQPERILVESNRTELSVSVDAAKQAPGYNEAEYDILPLTERDSQATVNGQPAQVQQLYPTFNDYQAKMRGATDRAVRQGWLLPPDAVDQMRRVCAIRPRYPAADQGTCKPYTPPQFASGT